MFEDAQILFFAVAFLASLVWMWWRLLDCAEETEWAREARLANEAQLRSALAARRLLVIRPLSVR